MATFPYIELSKLSNLKLPDYRNFIVTDQDGIENRRGGVKPRGVEIDLFWDFVTPAQVQAVQEFFNTIAYGVFGLANNQLPMPPALTAGFNSLRGVSLWKFREPPVITTQQATTRNGFYSMVVKLRSVDYKLTIGQPIFLIAQNSYLLTANTNLPEGVTWSQISGSNLNLTPGQNNVTLAKPGGGFINSLGGPIVIRATSVDDPNTYVDALIQTTPTNLIKGMSFQVGPGDFLPQESAIPQVLHPPKYYPPRSLQGTFNGYNSLVPSTEEFCLADNFLRFFETDSGAYLLVSSDSLIAPNTSGEYPVSWDAPTLYAEYLTGYTWEQNIGGVYTSVQSFSPSDYRVVVLNQKNYYRCVSNFLIGNRLYSKTSQPFYLNPDCLNPSLFADDVFSSLSFQATASSFTRTILEVTLSNVTYTDLFGTVSYQPLAAAVSSSRQPLISSTLNPFEGGTGRENIFSGVSYEYLHTSLTRVDQSGNVVG
jgi:hypothetical protein